MTSPDQALPYARADVALLPDSEQLAAAAARVGRSWGLGGGGVDAAEAAAARLRSAVMATAAAEEACWREYEFAAVELPRRTKTYVSRQREL